MTKKVIYSILIVILLTFSIKYGIDIIDNKELDSNNKENIAIYYSKKDNSDTYIGILNIPKIGLKRGFYQPNSKLNILSKNIMYLQESTENTIILAAHRGNSQVAFFEDLDKLVIGDILYLDYQNNKYKYILTEVYDELRDGKLNIYRNDSKDSLILITCNKVKKKYQTIYVSYREEV